jgi:hypothetical protein
MEHTYFDYGQEFSCIQHMFPKIINTEVLAETGLFYYDGDTTGYDEYPMKLLGHSLLHLVCFFDYTSHVIYLFIIIMIKFLAFVIIYEILYILF